MELLPDNPIIACMERTGYPPWYFDDHGRLMGEEEEWEEEDEDTEEVDV